MLTSPFYRENWSSQITELQITLAQDAIARNDPVTLQNVLGDGSDAGEIPLKSGHLHDTPPLYLAARVGTREIMETLLKYGTWMGCNFERLAMKIAIQCRNHAVLDVWLDPQWLSHNPLICPGPTFRAAFIECARVGDLEMVERLSGRCGGYSTDPAEIHFEAFLEAIRSGQVAVAEWILRLGWFEVENSTVRFSIPKSALFIALQDCHPPARVPMVRMLLSYRADPNELCPSVKGTPLQAAIELNNPELINLLLDHGADPSASTPGNMRLRAPLLYATRKGDVKLVRQFFEHGANPLIVFRGKTLLDEAKAGRILKEVTEILVEFEWAERFDKWMKSGKISE
ncbi:ankyrin repeat-containing domain protein [Aspergillus granulosus]|uniref:Ankyrin repeat-containing domain protein n=1 Tax=Aspergillus granulosus TaxID=176169 RepID=A0ABR4HLC9_9EURO